MKRSPIARRTPLPPRRTPLRSKAKELRRVALIRRRGLHHDPVWAAVRAVVWQRCGGRDEYTGEQLDVATFEGHHRRFRSRGGQHSPSNAVALTPRRHRFVHNRGYREAEARGFVVASTEDPAAVPVRLWDGRLVHLTPAGDYLEVAAAETEERA